MGPEAVNRKRQVITVLAVLVAFALIVGATMVAAKKKQTSGTSLASVSDATSESVASIKSIDSASVIISNGYKNGGYTADSSYESPGGTEEITVNLKITDGVVAESSVTSTPTEREAREFQQQFLSAYKQFVIGRKIDDISLSRVSGSSLTSKGFNDAVEQIKNQARG